MKKTAVLLVLFVVSACFARPTITTFKFDELPLGADAAAIGTYMSSVYGSKVEVTGATVVAGPAKAPLGNRKGDYYLQAGPSPAAITINFVDVPVTQVKFAWGADQGQMYGDIDGEQTFTSARGRYINWRRGWSRNYRYKEPVSTIRLYDGGAGSIAMDDLRVISAEGYNSSSGSSDKSTGDKSTGSAVHAPAPGALGLVIFGVGLLRRIRR